MITKPIKLHLDTYTKLDLVREKHESFNNVVRRLLMLHDQLEKVSRVMGQSRFTPGLPPSKEEG